MLDGGFVKSASERFALLVQPSARGLFFSLGEKLFERQLGQIGVAAILGIFDPIDDLHLPAAGCDGNRFGMDTIFDEIFRLNQQRSSPDRRSGSEVEIFQRASIAAVSADGEERPALSSQWTG